MTILRHVGRIAEVGSQGSFLGLQGVAFVIAVINLKSSGHFSLLIHHVFAQNRILVDGKAESIYVLLHEEEQ